LYGKGYCANGMEYLHGTAISCHSNAHVLWIYGYVLEFVSDGTTTTKRETT
jgi:hypothetical protein